MPTKAAYLRFEDDPDAEFQFFLAEKLHCTVAEIGQMSNLEYMRWGIWYSRKAQMVQAKEVPGGSH